MAYKFNFDLSNLPRSFFEELARVSKERQIHRRIGEKARHLSEKFNLYKLTGLPVSDGLMIVEDLIDVYINNIVNRRKFSRTKGKKALLLPHCSRKYMDNRCKATFDPNFSSYSCAHCSPDCLVNQATILGKKRGYDVYILPGGSCIKKILSKRKYSGIVGVACCEEIKLGNSYLKELGIPGQGVPLTKNGCSNTKFDIKTLKEIL